MVVVGRMLMSPQRIPSQSILQWLRCCFSCRFGHDGRRGGDADWGAAAVKQHCQRRDQHRCCRLTAEMPTFARFHVHLATPISYSLPGWRGKAESKLNLWVVGWSLLHVTCYMKTGSSVWVVAIPSTLDQLHSELGKLAKTALLHMFLF